MAGERRFWELLAESHHERLVLTWVSTVLTILVIAFGIFLLRLSIKPREVVVVPGAVAVGLYSAGQMPEAVIVDFARNFVVDLSNFTPVSAERSFLSAARYMSPELLSRFEPAAREQLKQLVGNRISQFFTVDSYSMEGRGPFIVRFLGQKVIYVGKTETERIPYYFRVTVRNVESTNENPYGLIVTSVEQGEASVASPVQGEPRPRVTSASSNPAPPE